LSYWLSLSRRHNQTTEEYTETHSDTGGKESIRRDNHLTLHERVHVPAGMGASIPELSFSVYGDGHFLDSLTRTWLAGSTYLELRFQWEDLHIQIVPLEEEPMDDILGNKLEP